MSRARTFAGKKISIGYDMASAESKKFAKDLEMVFEQAGWVVGGYSILGGRSPPSGLRLEIKDPTNLSTVDQTVISSLKDAGVMFDVEKLPGKLPNDEKVDVRVLVTPPEN